MLYLDTSALVRLVVREAESAALHGFLARHPAHVRFSSMLAHTELLRAVGGFGPTALATGRRALKALHLVDVSRTILEEAATVLLGSRLRSLDAVHLVTAATAQDRLRAIVTYDGRMAEAARSLGFEVASPARTGG